MRNLKSLLLIAVFTLGLGGVANAQKMGHIYFEKLVAEMPATKQLKADIEKLGKTYQDEIEGMAKKLDAKMKKYTAEQNNQTKEINEIRKKQSSTYLRMINSFLNKYPKVSFRKQKGKGNFVSRRKPKDSVLNINKSIKDQFNNLRISDNDLYPSFFYYRKNKYLLKISKDNKKK